MSKEEALETAAIEYLFSRTYSWETGALLDIAQLIDGIVSEDGNNLELLLPRLEQYKSGALAVPGHHPKLVNKILDAIITTLSHRERVVHPLLERLDQYHYLAIKMLGWIGPDAELAVPRLIEIANSTSNHAPIAVEAVRRIAGADSSLVTAFSLAVTEYKYFIDSLVERSRWGCARNVREGLWNQNFVQPPDPMKDTAGDEMRQHQYNNVLKELSAEQRGILAEMVQQASDESIFNALVFLTDEKYRLSRNGVALPWFPFGYTMYEDFITRQQGYPWPEEGHESNLLD
jgi:hypothetical protein